MHTTLHFATLLCCNLHIHVLLAHTESCSNSRSEEVQAAKTWLVESMEKYERGRHVVVEDKELQPNCETQFEGHTTGELQGGKKLRLRDNSNAMAKGCKCESHNVVHGDDKEQQQPNCQLGGDASSIVGAASYRRSRRKQGLIIGEHCQEEEEIQGEEEGRHDLGHGLHKCSSWHMLFTHVRAPPPHGQVVDQLHFGDKFDDTNRDIVVVVVVHPHHGHGHEQVTDPTLDMDHRPQAGDENNREEKKLGNDDGQQLEELANLKEASSAKPDDKTREDDNDTSSEETTYTRWSMKKGPAGSWSARHDDILMPALSKLHEQLRSCSSGSSSDSCVEDMLHTPERDDDKDDEARRPRVREQQGLQLGEGESDVFNGCNSSAGMRSKEEEDCEEKAPLQSGSSATSASSSSRSHDQENRTNAPGTRGGGDGAAAADCESSLEDQLQDVGLMDEDEWESCWWVQAGLAPFATQPQTTFGADDHHHVDRDDDDEPSDRGRAGWDDDDGEDDDDDDGESAAARRIAHASYREDDDAYAQVERLMREEDDAEVDRLMRELEERGLLGIEEGNWRMRDASWDDHQEAPVDPEDDLEELTLRPLPADTATATGGGGGGWSMRLDLAEMEEDLEAWVRETEEEQRRRQARERQVWSNPCLITATVTLVSLPPAATASGTGTGGGTAGGGGSGGGASGAGAPVEQTSDHEVREPPQQQQVQEEEEDQAAAAAAAGAAVHAAALGLVLAQCSICLDTPGQGDTVCILPLCRHTFHRDCIGKWFEYSVSCPYCRNNEM